MNTTALFTISSNNYYAFSKTMLQSVKNFHDEIDLFFLLVDEKADDRILQDQRLFNLRLVKDIGILDYKKMAFAYNILEFNTAMKPFFINYLFESGYDKVIYVDPDILVCNRLDDALNALNDHSIVLTPHQLSPIKNVDRFIPYDQFKWEQSLLQRGTYNLGFIGLSKTLQSKSFLEWWSNRCKYLCFEDPEQGLFVDQKWIDLALCFFPSTVVLRHLGFNMAVWNLHARRLIDNRVNGVVPLVFYHFSSIDINNPDIISKHDKTLKLKDRPDLIELFKAYREKVMNNNYDYFSKLPYSYDFFGDNRRIHLLERRLYAAVANNFPDPFSTPSDNFYSLLRAKRKENNISRNKPTDSLVVSFAKMCIRIVFKLIGVKSYTRLVRFFRITDSFRLHTFLID